MRYRLLGKLEVLDDDGSPIAIPAPKRRALLAALLISANRAVSIAELCDALWESEPPPTATESLHAHVSRLRGEIGADRIVSGTSGYTLQLSAGDLDILVAEAEVEAARAATLEARWRTAVHVYRQALARWRGPALSDFGAHAFAQPQIARLEELRLAALEGWVESSLALGQHADVLPELERLVTESPYRERLWQQLMVALYRTGRQADALAAYRRLRSVLREDLGIDPSASVRQPAMA